MFPATLATGTTAGPSIRQPDVQSSSLPVFRLPSSDSTTCTYKVATRFLDQEGIGQVGVENVVSSITSKTPEEFVLLA